MKGRKSSAEQIVAKPRDTEVRPGKGMALGEVCRQLETTAFEVIEQLADLLLRRGGSLSPCVRTTARSSRPT
jgi:hypothetical protein